MGPEFGSNSAQSGHSAEAERLEEEPREIRLDGAA
jgi:hypothetical protein